MKNLARQNSNKNDEIASLKAELEQTKESHKKYELNLINRLTGPQAEDSQFLTAVPESMIRMQGQQGASQTARNLRFEQFLEEVFSIDLTDKEKQVEIVQFVSLMETFYNFKIRELIEKISKKDSAKKTQPQQPLFMENELREILFDAIEQTRRRVEQRRNHQQRSEQYQKKSSMNSSVKPTLRYANFRPYDK